MLTTLRSAPSGEFGLLTSTFAAGDSAIDTYPTTAIPTRKAPLLLTVMFSLRNSLSEDCDKVAIIVTGSVYVLDTVTNSTVIRPL